MSRRLPLPILFLGVFLILGLLAAGKRQLVLDVNSSYVQKAAEYAISKIACPCAATHDDNHEHHRLRMTDIRSAEMLYGEEEDLLKIDGHVHTEHETGTHAHECSFYLYIRNGEVADLKEYTCFKFMESPTKHEKFKEELQPNELKAVENFAKKILVHYDQKLLRILTASKQYDKEITYVLHLFVSLLTKTESKFRDCIMYILYEPWTFYKYSLIKDSCH